MSRIQVILPAYNAAPYIREAVDSILHQTHDAFELIVINDGSTDETGALLDSYDDSRMRVLHQENQGLVASINRGIGIAIEEGVPFVARMDADDRSAPERLVLQERALENTEYAACSCNCVYIDVAGKPIGSSTVPIRHKRITWELRHNLRGMVHGATMFRTAALQAVGGFRTQFPHAEDVDLFLRLGEQFALTNRPEDLYSIRLNPDSMSVAASEANSLYVLYAIDCSWRRRHGRAEQSFEQFAERKSWRTRLSLAKERIVLDLYRRGMGGDRVRGYAAALLDPKRVVARIGRALERRRAIR